MKAALILIDEAREKQGIISEPDGSKTANGGWMPPSLGLTRVGAGKWARQAGGEVGGLLSRTGKVEAATINTIRAAPACACSVLDSAPVIRPSRIFHQSFLSEFFIWLLALDHGQIIERGKYNELTAKQDIYYNPQK